MKQKTKEAIGVIAWIICTIIALIFMAIIIKTAFFS
jgi:hypothetical protein